MTLEERLRLYDLVHGMNDRMLYLADGDKAKFVKAIEKIYETYPCPREVRYGTEARLNHAEKV